MTIKIPERELAAGEVHVWRLSLDIGEIPLPKIGEWLSAEERQRADRFLREVHRSRFIVGRGMMRAVLGRYCDLPPERLQLQYGANGKPELAPIHGARRGGGALHFNLAHSGEVGMLAVTRCGPVGVDIEQVRNDLQFQQLVARFFSEREAAEFSKLSPEQQPAAFFNLWTRKEALLKAMGEGIGHSLNLVEVSFLPGEPARVRSLPAGLWASCEWSLRDLAISPACAGALAAPVRDIFVAEFELPCHATS
jgi:4'-phosphopantetheinyl transferase